MKEVHIILNNISSYETLDPMLNTITGHPQFPTAMAQQILFARQGEQEIRISRCEHTYSLVLLEGVCCIHVNNKNFSFSDECGE